MPSVYIYPPLGALTSVQRGTMSFRVYIVLNSSDGDDRAAAAEIWTNMYGSEWQGIALKGAEECGDAGMERAFLDTSQIGAGDSSSVQQFSLDVQTTYLADCFEFTVRWRASSSDTWQWASSFGNNARVAVRRPADSRDPSLNHWRQQLNSLFDASQSHQQEEQPPQQQPVAIADSWHVSPNGASCIYKIADCAGLLSSNHFGCLANVESFLAFVRRSAFWIIPQCGAGTFPTDGAEIAAMLLQLKTGAYAAIIPFAKPTPASSAATGSIVFKAGPSNRMYVHPESSDLSSIRAAASVNQYPHDAMLEAFSRIQQLLSLPLSAPSVSTASPIADSEYQLAEHLGYCTWNTFYQNVTHAGLVNVLADIFEAGRSSSQPLPGWVLIDDGWQTVSECGGHGQLRDICANAERFPGQLRGTVTALQSLGVQRVGVWHALWGYWGGVDPDSLLGQRYALERFRRRSTSAVSGDADVWLVAASHVSKFYDEFYGWLRDQGISFVKVDYQAAFETLDNIYSSTGVSEMCHAYYTAMESSALKHFGAGSVIYCMSHSPQLILHALQQHQSTPGSSQPPVRMTFRNTDDYFPDVYDSHGWHIYCNMANTIWSRALAPNFIIDWDMFRPGGDVGRLHAVSRILSGGLFCITGHKPDYVGGNLASYVGPSGRVSLREPPLISSQCLFTDMTQSPGLLVGSTVVPESESVVIAAYNVSSGPVVAPLFVSRVCAEAMGFHARRSIGSTPGRHISDRTAGSSSVPTELPSNDLYVVHQHSTGQIRVTNVAGRVYAVALRSLTADIFTVTRMAAFKSPDRTAVLYAACIGDTSRCVGVDVVERNVYSAILPPSPNSPRGSGASKTSCSHLRCWNIRARVSLHSRHVVFVVSAREVVLQPRMLPANIDAVHISGDTIASDDWAFESETGVLRITLPTSRRADALATACCTISLSA